MVQKNKSKEDNPATKRMPTRVKLRRPRKRNPNLSRLLRKAKATNKQRNLTAREEIAEEAESHKVPDKKPKNQTPSKIKRLKTTTNNRKLKSLIIAAVETETEAQRMSRPENRSPHSQDNLKKTRMNLRLEKENNKEMKMPIEEIAVEEVEEVEETEMAIVVAEKTAVVVEVLNVAKTKENVATEVEIVTTTEAAETMPTTNQQQKEITTKTEDTSE